MIVAVNDSLKAALLEAVLKADTVHSALPPERWVDKIFQPREVRF